MSDYYLINYFEMLKLVVSLGFQILTHTHTYRIILRIYNLLYIPLLIP